MLDAQTVLDKARRPDMHAVRTAPSPDPELTAILARSDDLAYDAVRPILARLRQNMPVGTDLIPKREVEYQGAVDREVHYWIHADVNGKGFCGGPSPDWAGAAAHLVEKWNAHLATARATVEAQRDAEIDRADAAFHSGLLPDRYDIIDQ